MQKIIPPSLVRLAALVLILCSASDPALRGDPLVVPLWENGAPGFEALKDKPERILERNEPEFPSFPITTDIHNPSLLAFLPEKAESPAPAIIIAPGGGHRFLTMGREGTDLAAWLQDKGIAAFVLKYRLARAENSPYSLSHSVEDAVRSVALVRERSADWNIDPDKIGMIGFSAGGRPALGTVLGKQAPALSRPNFLALVYAEIPNLGPVTKSFPPTFLAVTFDDTPKADPALELARRLKSVEVATELHMYSKGGHGYGVANRPEFPVSQWPDRFLDWLQASGFAP